MVLIIVVAHRPNHTLDERNLVLRDAVLLVEGGIRPCLVPGLYRNPAVHSAENVLGRLSKRNKESRKSRSKIRLDALCLDLRTQRTGDKVGLSTNGPWLTNY